ncbi:unnamed protein product [Oppiella nova]|uniref:Probable ATP-dependent RNA helicase DDX46 n=1 Tax=Oppiella nova TaxID=334625 RepID=A0A7R9Q9U2_9ACAR|nr:unnamed protein product [Oppiella nova]CAG2161432.1 unnamed protein product [Oppiella nova]
MTHNLEADRMFDMGFEPQVMRINDGIRPDRQTVMFSATFPRIMEGLARRILDKPIEVQVGGRSMVCKEVKQNVIITDEDDKFLKLLEILGHFASEGSAIVFVDKQENADMLLKELMHASYTCLALHGGIDQNDRDSTIADFKNGKVNVLVATSVAARGELKPGAEIVVCTPGRMIDMLAANSGRVTNLRRCTYCVLDEADRMFDMGFEPQVMRIIDGIRPDRQTVMFSATFPRIMEALARRILDKPIEVQVGGRSMVCKEVKQNVIITDEDDKFLKLLEILGHFASEGSAIVFVDKQENADMLLKELMHASYTCLALHGGIDQNDRDSTIADFKNGKVNVLVATLTIADFKNGKVNVLVATSVAARGLDVKHCIVVINYDCPNHYEDYVHRCGRTGRAGNEGHAYTLITPEQGKYATDIIKAFQSSNTDVPAELQSLWEGYKLEQEMMGKKVKSSSGFSGKGFKFDEAEAQFANEKKKFQKAALGLQDSDDEDAEDDIDQEIENMLAPKKSTKSVPIVSNATTAHQINDKTVAEKLELAKRMASKISVNIAGKASSTTEAFLKGETFSMGASNAFTAKSKAEQVAERLHAKLNYVPKDVEYNEDGDIVRKVDEEDMNSGANIGQRFEEELEINEFPQQARWKVTSKEALAQISEYSEAGITVRGTYFPSGKEPQLGERKLYLAIEGTTELSVSKARAEIIRLIKEEMIIYHSENSTSL